MTKRWGVQVESLIISLNAAAMAIILLALLWVLGTVAVRGLAHFWPAPVYHISYKQQQQIRHTFGRVEDDFINTDANRRVFAIPNARSGGQGRDLLLLQQQHLRSQLALAQILQLNLHGGGLLLGTLSAPGQTESKSIPALAKELAEVDALKRQHQALLRGPMAQVHRLLAEYYRQGVDPDAPAYARQRARFAQLNQQAQQLQADIDSYQLGLYLADGERVAVPLANVRDYYFPNQLTVLDKLKRFCVQVWRFLSDSPGRVSQSGGVFPAIFGTVLMVLLMSVLVTPLGVLVAIYLHEYAPHNWLTGVIRIGVNNLAGVPSIVYGIFGLGLFVYGVGGQIDRLFYAEHLPSPTFGSPGLFWAALTMALLTLPVVIVASEEGLRRVPNSLREGSYALGATQYETIRRTLLPMASPGIMTGVILAIARGAGEVAPLILVGAVKFAPVLPVDGEFPYLHLERQFMHLGVLIYDGAFHSHSAGQGSSMMFAACLLLLGLVLLLNFFAISIRGRLRRRYGTQS